MGLGASGILTWETAIAFALGADLGTTITSWMASLNLSKNAKRAAYAHIGFNFIGVAVVLLLFFPTIWLLKIGLDASGVDPGMPVMIAGEETFPGVPIAIGTFSIAFNVFNVLILFPFVGTFERVLSRVGYSASGRERRKTLVNITRRPTRSVARSAHIRRSFSRMGCRRINSI